MRWRKKLPHKHMDDKDMVSKKELNKVVHEQVKNETQELDRRVTSLETFADAVVATYKVVLDEEADGHER